MAKPTLKLADRTFHCGACGLTIDRDLNAARNIAQHADTAEAPQVASGRGETQNARRASLRLPSPRARQQDAMKREDAQPHGQAPPRQSNPPTSHHPGHEQAKLF
ncbi:zinc ribbon domain-containing protein [Streptomyces sp. NPDC026206]|uniref:zinc ribbon domain-containing protein n=1 Tax=Streptomyces sp. NPDC026206 TaxID=3157089 RepID=UPI0033DDC557